MQLRLFKLRFRRRLRSSQRQVEDLSVQAEANLERHFFRRLAKLGEVWRFLTAWVVLLLLLIGCLVAQIEALSSHFQMLQPVPGGTYTEGVLGTFTNANPLYATSEVDTTVSHLVFSGLMKYNDQNQLVGDLASNWEVDGAGKTYTVHLRPNLTWQDGKPLTADDVVFTYQAIQNPDAQSPLQSSWQGITVAKKNAYTITFTLPNPLSSFPYTLTNGIVPMHLLSSLPASSLRSADFNTVQPIGSGPFQWDVLNVSGTTPDNAQVLIALKPFAHYYAGRAKLDSFVVHTFSQQDQLVKAFRNQSVTGIAGLKNLPSDLAQNNSVQQYSLLLSAETMIFFNTSTGILADPQVRHALIDATSVPTIVQQLGYASKAVNEPILKGQLAYDPAYAQSGFNIAAAKATLDADSWLVGKGGIRYKGTQPLTLALYATDDSEYSAVAHKLQSEWRNLGIDLQLRLQSNQEFQVSLASRSYDAVLYGISIGVDPDVFVYWDSSQLDPRSARLNFSMYKSTTADASLEAGRTRLDASLRVVKYKPFLQAWQQDAPALGLYQPRFLYVTHEKVYGLNEHTINSDTDRFDNVGNWMIRTAKVTNPQ
jgi:peptide/nickel transport system substrate-binding protein